MQNYVGNQIDRYRITERLGMGGMAVVYKAYDTRLERDVALKLIRTEAIPPEQYDRLMKRFEREAKSQARFDHKNIVHVYDYGEVDGSPYLVMAFISGGTLKERLHGPVDWRQAVRWLIPVAEALAYAHQRGIIHRDVKPANILFDEEGQPILTDFGIAKVLETNEATLTGTGLGVGTPEYMAPEQWQGKTSAATDQYALGVVLYELITGRKPYSADTPAAIILMQANEPLQSPSGLVKDIPPSVEKVLYKALARDPQDRYEDMEAFALALRGLLAEAETAEPIPPQKDTAKAESAPASAASESVTRDALDATPIEEMNAAPKAKRGLPKWALWAGFGIVLIVILGLAIGIGGNLVDMGKGGEGPLAMLATETATATATVTPTVTKTAMPSKTATITPTPESILGFDSRITSVTTTGIVVLPDFSSMGIVESLNFLDSNNLEYSITILDGGLSGIFTHQDPEPGTPLSGTSEIRLWTTGELIGEYTYVYNNSYENNQSPFLGVVSVAEGDILYIDHKGLLGSTDRLSYAMMLGDKYNMSSVYWIENDSSLWLYGRCYRSGEKVAFCSITFLVYRIFEI
ncbi:MAG: serine/threonine protein kinase [Anaerolineaceae bacterium]|nr:serine/threonine protein kinase [Anaerolineaceae bacterium]